MDLDADLNKFRETWRQELSKDSGSSTSIHSLKRQDEDCGNSTNDTINYSCDRLKNESQNVQNKSFTLGRGSSAFIVKRSQKLADADKSPDSFDDDSDVAAKSKETNVAEQYYPFKIVTQFLNEAPHKAQVTRKRAKVESLPDMTYSKKKYFYNNFHQDEKNTDVTTAEKQKETSTLQKDKRILDLFIADLDEINEIPFFDTSLPREVAFKIFQYLDMTTLCICSQVSHSWKSLSDDDLLWFRICQKFGFDTNSKVLDDRGWKNRMREHIKQRKALEVNWKGRVGKPYRLNFARGGVLCSVTSHDSNIVAGYTSCQVRSWNTQSGDVLTFNASNTALIIDEEAENLGCIHNEVRHLSATTNVIAASFKHGFVDVWKNDQGVDPVQTIQFNNPDISSLCAQDVNSQCSLVAASQQTRVQVFLIDETEGKKFADIDMNSMVSKMMWIENCKSKASLIMSCSSSVWMKDFDINSPSFDGVVSQDNLNMVEIHNLIYAPVTCLGTRSKQHEVGVGFNMITGSSSQVKLNIYDLNVRQMKASLNGHTWLISSMDMPNELPHQLVTGSGDRKVRLFDLRAGNSPMTTMIGHNAKVTCVQMDSYKIVSGDEAGFVCVWDERNGRKLWEVHNRHPVGYCHFDDRLLIIGNIPYDKFPEKEFEVESVSSLRYRGTVQCYDFLADQQTQGVPDICLSSYNEPEAFDYNLGLAVPYDSF